MLLRNGDGRGTGSEEVVGIVVCEQKQEIGGDGSRPDGTDNPEWMLAGKMPNAQGELGALAEAFRLAMNQQPDHNSLSRVSQPPHFENLSNKDSTPAPTGLTSVKECYATLALLHQPGSRFEVRVLPQGKWRRFNATPEGLQEAAEYAAVWSDCQLTKGVYTTLNPIGTEPEKAATDACIEKRIWLPIDVDPVRPPNTNSTGGEDAAARDVVSHAIATLNSCGRFYASNRSVLGWSGNGRHYLLPIDLPNDEPSRELIQDILKELALLCDKAWATVDTSIYNASRIVKLYGTWTRKGPHTEERPWRKAWLPKDTFYDLTPYPAEQLYELRRNLIWHRQPQKPLVNPNLAITGPRIAENVVLDVTPQPEPPPDAPHAPPSNGHDDHWKMIVSLGADALRRARAYLASCDPAISGQHGHDQTFKVAIKIGPGFNLTPNECVKLLLEDYNPRCVPPWTEEELWHKVSDAYEKEPRRGWMLEEDRQSEDQKTGTISTSSTQKRTAHLGDLKRDDKGRFLWPQHLVRAHLNVLSSHPKVGKTHFGLDLARRIWFGLSWPDGQPMTLPPGTKTLWVPGDRHQDELFERAVAFGIPVEAILLNADEDNPYGGVNLDDPQNIDGLRNRTERDKPGLILIDTIWRTTQRKMYREDDVNTFINPLIDIAQTFDTTLLAFTHLNANDETLGKRLDGVARSILKLTQPDPEQLSRRKLEVTGNFKEPEPLGMTFLDHGFDYDDDPPTVQEKKKGGRPNESRIRARTFILNAIDADDHLVVTHLRDACIEKKIASKDTFYRALDDIVANGKAETSGGLGTGQQYLLHRIKS